MNERQLLEQYRSKPVGQNILRTLRFAEGTERKGPDSYRVMFGGGLAPNLKAHPDTVIKGGKYASAAAGAYQFLPGTWESHAKALGLTSFGPAEQDLAALRGIRNRLRPIGGLATLEKEGFSPRVSAALAPEWASLPTESGQSYYGQPVKKLSELQKVFGQAPQPTAPPPQVAQAPTSTPSQKGNELGAGLLQQVMGVIPFLRQKRSSLPGVPGVADLLSMDTGFQAPSPQYFLQMFMGDDA